MVGVSEIALVSSSYVVYAAVYAVTSVALSFFAHFGLFGVWIFHPIFPLTNPLVLFLFFWLFCLAFVSFAYTLQAFFSRAKVGAVVSSVIFVLCWILYIATSSGTSPLPMGLRRLLCLLPAAGTPQSRQTPCSPLLHSD